MARSDRLLELAIAILLALATTLSAWCAYQSTRWGGIQTFRLNDSDAADRQAAELQLRAYNMRLLDTAMFIQLANALQRKDLAMQQFYLERFRPEMRTAVDAWLATQPMINPAAPIYPFAMPEYRLSLADQALEARKLAAFRHDTAIEAKQQSDQYMLLTVLLASVLFFGGIAPHFISSHAKIAVFALAMLTFIGVLFWLGNCRIAP